MNKTALHDTHVALGAKMVPYAGYEMPVQYAGVNEEHQAVREKLGVFDVSHMGEFYVRGPKALELIQKISSNDASKLTPGKIQYAYMPNNDGGVVDDLLVYCMSEDEYMLVVNASNMEKDWAWIQKHNTIGAELENASEQISLLAVQGPKATEALQSLTDVDLNEIKFYNFKVDKLAGIDSVLISATGYTGSGGFELYVPNKDAKALWDAVMKAGEPFGIQPAGLAARDTLRLEMGFCLYGNDIDETTSPLEAGLGWTTKFTKDFINSEALKREKEEGISQKLVGFELLDRGIPRKDYEIANENGEIVGRVTSGTMSPSLKKAIGMGYVPKEMAVEGTEIKIAVRSKMLSARVVKTPFYKS